MTLKRFGKSFHYAFRGLCRVFQDGQNFRFQIFAGLCALLLALFLQISAARWMLLFAIIFFVLILECINTAVEVCADIVKPRLSEQVKIVKDIMAGAVLLASLFSIIIGIYIFAPALRALLVEQILIP